MNQKVIIVKTFTYPSHTKYISLPIFRSTSSYMTDKIKGQDAQRKTMNNSFFFFIVFKMFK